MTGIRIYRDRAWFYAETIGGHPSLGVTYRAGLTAEEATRNAVKLFPGLTYISGEHADAKTASELGISIEKSTPPKNQRHGD